MTEPPRSWDFNPESLETVGQAIRTDIDKSDADLMAQVIYNFLVMSHQAYTATGNQIEPDYLAQVLAHQLVDLGGYHRIQNCF